jgi:hypothetical protein
VAMDMGQIPHALSSRRAARHAPRVIVTLVRFLRG